MVLVKFVILKIVLFVNQINVKYVIMEKYMMKLKMNVLKFKIKIIVVHIIIPSNVPARKSRV